MPRSNSRPANRKPRKWRIKMAAYPFTAVTTYPFGRKDRKGKRDRLPNLTVAAARGEQG